MIIKIRYLLKYKHIYDGSCLYISEEPLTHTNKCHGYLTKKFKTVKNLEHSITNIKIVLHLVFNSENFVFSVITVKYAKK